MSPLNEDDLGGVYLDESDIINEVILDDEDLPDVVDDEDFFNGSGSDSSSSSGSECDYYSGDNDSMQADDGMLLEGGDDSVHVFTRHAGPQNLLQQESGKRVVIKSPTDATLVATGGGHEGTGATGREGKRGFIWRVIHGDWTAELAGHEVAFSCLSFSHDGQLLASGGLDSTVNIWDINGNHKHKFEYDVPKKGVEFEVRWHPRGHLVLAGSTDSCALMWNADNGKHMNTFLGHVGAVTCGDFTPDGKIVCTGSKDATLRVWNPITCEAIHVVKGHPYHANGLTCLAISSDSTVALTCAEDGSAKIVNIKTGKVVSSLSGHSDTIKCVEFAPSMPWAATGGIDNKLIIWDLSQSSPRCICDHKDTVTCLKWIGTSGYLATGCDDGRIRIWDSRSGNCVRTFCGHSESIQSLSLSCSQDFLVSVSYDRTARVFETAAFK